MLQSNPDLKTKINQLWNKFWAGGIWIPPEQRPPKWSDWDDAQKKAEEQTNRFAVDKNTLRWSHFKRMAPDKMLDHVQRNIFAFIKDLNGEESNFTHHMRNAVFIIPKPSLLDDAV